MYYCVALIKTTKGHPENSIYKINQPLNLKNSSLPTDTNEREVFTEKIYSVGKQDTRQKIRSFRLKCPPTPVGAAW